MPKILTASKLDWYEKLGFGIDRSELNPNTVGINQADGHGGPITAETVRGRRAADHEGEFAMLRAHVTLYRSVWTLKFRPSDDSDLIVDRIFGSGALSVHCTIEDSGEERAPRIYWGGENFGRTPKEKQLLSDMLNFYMNRARAIVDEMKQRFDEFVWPDNDNELEQLRWDPADHFRELAALASRKTGCNVVWPKQKDAALLWSTAAIHPMQPLQNSYQRLVRDAVRDIKDDDAKKLKEGEELGHYCYFESAVPRLLAQPKDAEGGMTERLEKVEKDLSKLRKEVGDKPAKDADIDKEAKARADRALMNLLTVRAFYSHGRALVPALAAADKQLAGIDVELGAAKSWALLDKVVRKLTRAHGEMEEVHKGLCSIQNFHVIEPFYLFRLLVKFRIESDGDIPAMKKTEVSSIVTGLLHNHERQAWLFNWLRDKLIDLNRQLGQAGGDDVKFFLKGGRAAKYLIKKPNKGENDWDTSIVINPNLRAARWYELFYKVHNLVLVFLQQAKADFLLQCYEHAEEFAGAVEAWRKKEQDDREDKAFQEQMEGFGLLTSEVEAAGERVAEQAVHREAQIEGEKEPVLDVKKENCKAELIDIGIPRRDTVEAFEQWEHFVPDVFTVEGMPIPGHLYYISEYVMMIRDAFADNTTSMIKTPKRVIRLREVLMLDDLVPFIDRERRHIPPAVLPQSVPRVDSLPVAEKSVLVVALKQFAEALDFDVDPGLAKAFDELFAGSVADRKSKAKYPRSLEDAIAKQDGYSAEYAELGDAIGYMQWVAETIGAHMAGARAKFLKEQRKVLGSFIKAIYTASLFSQDDGLEVQFAVTGSFAALLHAEYAGFERVEELDPLSHVDLTIYCQRDADPGTVRELITPLVQQYLIHPQTVHFKLVPHGRDSLCLYWPTKVAFSEEFFYTPLVLKITVKKCDEDWPQLAFVRGFPVLGLRDLVWEYKRRAGHVEETFTQRRLKKAIEGLIDILTRFENLNAGAPWVRPGIPSVEIRPPDPVPPPVQLDDEDKDGDGLAGEASDPNIIRIPKGPDCLFAAILKGAEERGITGQSVMSLRGAVADELKDSAYAPVRLSILNELIDSIPVRDGGRSYHEDALAKVGDPRLARCVEDTYWERRKNNAGYRSIDEAAAFEEALRGGRYRGGEWEAGLAGSAIKRRVCIHREHHPVSQANQLRDEDPIRLLFDGDSHYDVYRKGFTPG